MFRQGSTRAAAGVVALFTLALFLVVLAPFGHAAPVPEPVARGVAGAFLHGIGWTSAAGPTGAGSPGIPSVSDCPAVPIASGGPILAWLFPLGVTGYVVVPADDELPPVIAYSLEASYPAEAGTDNPLFRMLAADLRNRMEALPAMRPARTHPVRQAWAGLAGGTFRRDDRFEQWPPAGTTPTGGWLESNWTQNAPYNNLCPLDLAHGGARSLAGCPSVAMAMILNFHETTHSTQLGAVDRYWHAYQGNNYWIPDAAVQYGFPDFFTLNSYLQTLNQHWQQGTPLTNTDKAALVFACGVAEQQVYSASGSGTFGVNQAYDGYQRFAFTDSRLVHDTDPEMYSDMALQMQSALPAHLAVVDPGWTMGHNVVVDGWNTDNFFHVNFGWGGSYNGWYLLPSQMPYGLTVVEGVILDILPVATAVGEAAVASLNLSLASEPNPFTASCRLGFLAPAAGRARLGIYDVSGRLLQVIMDGEVAPGEQTRTWTPGARPAGVYFARIELNGETASRSILLAR